MSDPLFEGLNEAQASAVMHKDGPLMIVAGAGTGKTTVLTRRYAHLLSQEGISSENILALTFTEKSATEMEDRVLKLLETGTYDFWISTFHGFCQRILEAHALEIGLPNKFRLLTSTDAWLLLKRRMMELPLDHYRPLGNPVKFLRALLQHFSRAKDEDVTPEMYLEFAQNTVLDGDSEFITGERKRLQELADVYFAYRKILREEGSLDMNDLIMETLRLFRERPAVLEKYRKQFKYIMVDEFQDTNWAQYEMLKLLCGKERNMTVVGDDDQAIYKFRGASLANILQFRDDFPEAKTVALVENYRSHKEILDVAYRFIKKNDPNRLEVRLADTGLSKELKAMRGEGGSVEVIWKKTVEDETEAVAAEIKGSKKKTQKPPGTIFVFSSDPMMVLSLSSIHSTAQESRSNSWRSAAYTENPPSSTSWRSCHFSTPIMNLRPYGAHLISAVIRWQQKISLSCSSIPTEKV
jgi:DNA helicase-2/ATP-dependent DNA helicase PcrA